MTPEAISLFLGSGMGAVTKILGVLIGAQRDQMTMMLDKQKVADESHNQAAKRGGEWTRRMIVITVLFAVVIAPFLLAHSPEGITVGSDKSWLFGLLKFTDYQTLSGYLILPEIRQTVLAIVGFYFGSSQIK